MADHGCGISLSQISHTSDEESSDHSPRNFATLSGGAVGSVVGGASGSSSFSRHRKLSPSAGYGVLLREPAHHEQQILSSSTKKPRGRPPGSKNKPKPPLVINQDSEQALKPVVIEVAAGSDVVEALVSFARRRHVGISVLSGSGSVSNVTLRHPLSHAPAFTLHGPFTLLSLSGTYISTPFASAPATASAVAAPSPSNPPSFGICLSGSQGQVFGGVVGGQVVAASVVVVVVSVFKKPEFHRVPINGNGEGEEENPSGGGGGGGGNAGVGGDQGGNDNSNSNAMTMSAFNVAAASSTPNPLSCQVPAHADVNVMQWGHSTRPANY